MNELVFACLLRGRVCEKAVFPLLFIIFFFSTSSFRGFFFPLCFSFSSFFLFHPFLFFERVRGEVGGRLIIHQEVPYCVHFGHISLHYELLLLTASSYSSTCHQSTTPLRIPPL